MLGLYNMAEVPSSDFVLRDGGWRCLRGDGWRHFSKK